MPAQNPFAEGGMFRAGGEDQLQALAGNPMFNIGMGLLAAGQNESINPFTSIMGGLKSAGSEQRTMDKETRDELLRELLKEFFANQGGDPSAGMQPQIPPGMPTPGQPPGMQGPPGRNYGMPQTPTAAGPPGRNYDPMQDLYRAGWDRALRPR